MSTDPVVRSVLITPGLDDLARANPIQAGRVSPHRLHDGDGFRLRHLAFDAGAELAEHVAPRPILVHVLDGSIRFTVEGTEHTMARGAVIHVPANVPHALVADEPSHVLLLLLG